MLRINKTDKKKNYDRELLYRNTKMSPSDISDKLVA